MDALLTAIVLWLSLNFGLPASFDHPKVEFAPPLEITFLRFQAFTAEARRQVLTTYAQSGAPDRRREVVAVYDSKRNTIVLPLGWSGRSPAELSALVHEMVHHLQKSAGLKYECPAQREKLAYEAQEKWLSLFGLTLENEFEIDPFTLKVSTECGY
jgi:hypothetical protein